MLNCSFKTLADRCDTCFLLLFSEQRIKKKNLYKKQQCAYVHIQGPLSALIFLINIFTIKLAFIFNVKCLPVPFGRVEPLWWILVFLLFLLIFLLKCLSAVSVLKT